MPDWNILPQPTNALQMFGIGAQMGQQTVDRQQERERQNALLDLKRQELEGKQNEARQELETADVRTRAAGGDPQALAELAGLDFQAWRGLSEDQREAGTQRMQVLGNAALDILQRPPDQRAAVWDSYIDQLSQTMPEMAQYRGQYSEQSARSVVAQAEMMGKLHDLERPRYQAIPEGGTLVNTNSPQAVQEFTGGAGNIPAPPPGFQLDQGGPGGSPSGAGFPGS